jgi:uncharacterized protein YggT (Ycf19 family)
MRRARMIRSFGSEPNDGRGAVANATRSKHSDGSLVFIRICRALTLIVYAYATVAASFLALAFVLQLLGANYSTGFVEFVYKAAYRFLQPFRGIFPTTKVSETSYFNASALFAIVMYLIFAVLVHALLSWLTVKKVKHEQQLAEAEARQRGPYGFTDSSPSVGGAGLEPPTSSL